MSAGNQLDRQFTLSSEEGGPNGIGFDKTGTVLAVTCEEEQLAFFTLASVLGNA